MGLRNDPAFQKAQDKAKENSSGYLPITKGFLNAKDRDLLEVPFKVHAFRLVHKDLAYWPSGDPNPAHDEVMLAIEFRDNAEEVINKLPQESKFPVVQIGEVYGISTRAKTIVETFKWLEPDRMPLDDVCFREDLSSRPFVNKDTGVEYYPLYIDDYYAQGFPSEEAPASPFDRDGPEDLHLEQQMLGTNPSSTGPEAGVHSSPTGRATGKGTQENSPRVQPGKPQGTATERARAERGK